MKKASRNKFLLCFRPVVDVDQFVLESKGGDIGQSKNRALSCASMDRIESLRRSVTHSSFSDYSTSSGLILHLTKRNISQSKRVSDTEGLCQDPKASKRSFSMRRKKSLDKTKDFSVDNVLKTQDFITISGLSASSSTGLGWLLEPNQERGVKPKNQKIKNMKREAKPKNSDKTGIHVVLISLAVTVIWGKFYAIIFTSLWLYFLPGRHTKDSICRPEYVSRSTEEGQSKENKKRVTIEGLLERNRQQMGREGH